MTDTTTPAPTDDLQKRCAEIIGWHRTGVLVGDALRSHAESKWPGAIRNLQMAERATENEAICFIAKWGAPAPASGAAEAGLRADIHESLKYEGPDGWEADWGDVIDAVEKHHGITAAQKEAP